MWKLFLKAFQLSDVDAQIHPLPVSESIFRAARGEIHMPSNQPAAEPRQPRTGSDLLTIFNTTTDTSETIAG